VSRTIETHRARNPRLLLFHGIVAGLLLVLVSGMAYRQLFKSGLYSERERLQNQRRVVVPGPRGRILDRDGNVLVDNRARFSVVLNLAELRGEFRAEYKTVKANYSKLAHDEQPDADQLTRIARASVAQRYLDRVNAILNRHEAVRTDDLSRHVNQTLLLPYVLLDDLAPEEYARLIERLPVTSPLQVYASSTRYYPYHSAASHVLGYTSIDNDPEVEDFPGDDLLTFKMKGSFGRDGLEKQFDSELQGETGGAIYRVDPAGYKVDLPIEKRLPVQGRSIATSLDIELQQAAEQAMEGRTGAAVALDIRTGEVLVLASKPDYDLNEFVPRLSAATFKEIQESGGWLNRAIQGQYPPGSTFKIVTATAALRSGAVEPGRSTVRCPGYLMIGNRRFACDEVHGDNVDLVKAITRSCNVFFYTYGLEMGPELLAAEAHRFGFDHKTGIELPGEFSNPHVASPAWKKAFMNARWMTGDTANTAIGQGDTLVNPLQVACMVASFARGETETKPTLLHDPARPTQHTEAVGLTPSDYNAILLGLEQCYQVGTARLAKVDGLRGAAKTGTAQKGRIDLAWMVAFAPLENPQIAVAVVMEGTEPDVSYHGGTYAAPVVKAVLQAWKDKSERPPVTPVNFKMR
jgi:penicillin-binding protein 2